MSTVRSRSLRITLTTGFVAAGLVTLAGASALSLYENVNTARSSNRMAASRLATGTATELGRAFDEWKNELLVASQDDALRNWYTDAAAKQASRRSIDRNLVGLHTLYPDLIDEACYIDAKGPEISRQVRGTVAPVAELSPDESGNPFFAATLALRPGEVHQHTPYVSPDSQTWVVSHSTPIRVGGRNVAMLHFETELDPLRQRVARLLPRGARARVLDSTTHELIFQTDVAVPAVDTSAVVTNQSLPRAMPWAVPHGDIAASADVALAATNANHWSIEVQLPEEGGMTSGAVWRLLLLACVVLASLAATGLAFSRRIVDPLAAVTRHAERLAAGDLTGSAHVERHDEIGRLAAAVDTATTYLAGMVRELRGSDASLSAAATQLSAVSSRLAEGAARASSLASSASEASAEVDGGVQTLTAGAGQLAQSVGEIAASAHRASGVTQESVEAVRVATAEIGQLGTASAEIGGVVRLITSIAEQTNLLALNATIEAARAGEAGKGFAVVAEEVKQLARETAHATGDISARIASIQERTRSAAVAVDGIAAVIGQISEFSTTIAVAAQEQAATTGEMSRAVTSAADGSTELSRRIASVAEINHDTSEGARTSRLAAEEISSVAARIAHLVQAFVVPQ